MGDRIGCRRDRRWSTALDLVFYSSFVLLLVRVRFALILTPVAALNRVAEFLVALSLHWSDRLSINFGVSISKCDALA
jgi:hypothetical protein